MVGFGAWCLSQETSPPGLLGSGLFLNPALPTFPECRPPARFTTQWISWVCWVPSAPNLDSPGVGPGLSAHQLPVHSRCSMMCYCEPTLSRQIVDGKPLWNPPGPCMGLRLAEESSSQGRGGIRSRASWVDSRDPTLGWACSPVVSLTGDGGGGCVLSGLWHGAFVKVGTMLGVLEGERLVMVPRS